MYGIYWIWRIKIHYIEFSNMAITSRKISSFPSLGTLTGEEYLMVAYKGKSYKITV